MHCTGHTHLREPHSVNKQIRWLQSEIREWTQEGLIDEQTRQAILQRYSITDTSGHVDLGAGISIITVLGALIFGLGIILFFAFNWSELAKAYKLGIIFSALLLSHTVGLLLNGRKTQAERNHLVEGFHFLGTMVFGAGIWLIAQIYHMDEHYPTAFLLWGCGALLLAWALPSVLQAVAACVLFGVWGISELMEINRVHLYSLALIAIGILPLAWTQRSALLLTTTLLSLAGLTLANMVEHSTVPLSFYQLYCTSLLLVGLSHFTVHSHFPASAASLQLVGAPAYGVCLFLLTFLRDNDLANTLALPAAIALEHPAVFATWGLLIVTLLLCLALCAAAFRRSRTTAVQSALVPGHWVLMLVATSALTLQAGGLIAPGSLNGMTPVIFPLLFNAIFAAHCIVLIISGSEQRRGVYVFLGCATLIGLILIRFQDLFHSLLQRSLAFLIIGALVFAVGHWYARKKTHYRDASEAVHA